MFEHLKNLVVGLLAAALACIALCGYGYAAYLHPKATGLATLSPVLVIACWGLGRSIRARAGSKK